MSVYYLHFPVLHPSTILQNGQNGVLDYYCHIYSFHLLFLPDRFHWSMLHTVYCNPWTFLYYGCFSYCCYHRNIRIYLHRYPMVKDNSPYPDYTWYMHLRFLPEYLLCRFYSLYLLYHNPYTHLTTDKIHHGVLLWGSDGWIQLLLPLLQEILHQNLSSE